MSEHIFFSRLNLTSVRLTRDSYKVARRMRNASRRPMSCGYLTWLDIQMNKHTRTQSQTSVCMFPHLPGELAQINCMRNLCLFACFTSGESKTMFASRLRSANDNISRGICEVCLILWELKTNAAIQFNFPFIVAITSTSTSFSSLSCVSLPLTCVFFFCTSSPSVAGTFLLLLALHRLALLVL